MARDDPEGVLREYEAALASQQWARVEPLMHPDVCVTFSNGKSFRGREDVGKAFAENFSLIEDERYEIADVHWIAKDECHAACAYVFRWSGVIRGEPAKGAGRGTTLVTSDAGTWLILAEHLGPLA